MELLCSLLVGIAQAHELPHFNVFHGQASNYICFANFQMLFGLLVGIVQAHKSPYHNVFYGQASKFSNLFGFRVKVLIK